jgi:signal peptide peptidase SppA
MRAFVYAADRPWAITEAGLRQILEIAERTNPSPEAVAAKLGRPLENTRTVEVRDGVAVIPVTGPIFRYANLLTEISGATSIEVLARDFSQALEDPGVRAIVLNVNSPGGEADGVNELSRMIYEARGRKPTIAYVGGLGASGAYWLASAADQIVAEESALLGSVGVVATFRDTRERDAKAGVVTYEIVSSQSPLKRPDPATDSGRGQIQQIVDAQAEILVNAVARNRGVSPERVLADFGQGNLLPAAQAVRAGMADRLGTFESVVSALAAQFPKTKGVIRMDEPVSTAVAAPDARLAERERIAAILNSPEAEGRETLAQAIALESDLDAEAARKLLASAPAASAPSGFHAAMAALKNPAVGAGADEPDSDATEVQRIVAIHNSMRRN